MSRWQPEDQSATEHQRALELLPWLVSGRLDPDEREWVGRHLEGCAACREEADLCLEVAAHLKPWAAAPAPHPAHFTRLLSRLDAPLPVGREVPGSATDHHPRAPSPHRLGWFLAAQALLVVVMLGAGAWLSRSRSERAPAFRTLSESLVQSTGPEIRVIFRPGASESEIRAALHATGTEIVGGPSPRGAYRVAAASRTDDAVDEILVQLRAQDAVTFAEPVAGRSKDER